MELISITPKNMWEDMFEQNMSMCLTHLVLKYPEYAKMAKNSKSYKMLDNSIVELGESVTLKEILKAADMIDANEIILRDAYPNGPKTIERVKEDIEYLRNNDLTTKYKIMAVCHGENIEDFKNTFEYLNSVPEITCIGIPKVLSRWVKERANLFDTFKNTDKEIHFLGSWYNLKEVYSVPQEVWDRVRSCDTCLPSYYAITGKPINEDRDGTIDLEKEYQELTKEKHQEILNKFMEERNSFNGK